MSKTFVLHAESTDDIGSDQSMWPFVERTNRMIRLACLALFVLAGPLIAAEPSPLAFGTLPALPGEFGLGGPIAGTIGNSLVVTGGANFPHGPPWPVDGRAPGAKVWHDRTFVLRPGATKWSEGPRLPHPLAYAPAVSTPDGVYVLGGETFDPTTGNVDTAEVLRIGLDAEKWPSIHRHALPPLPKPCSYHAAGLIGREIFVAASHRRDARSRRLDVPAFWSLDLAVPGGRRKWIERPVWPGPPRFKMSVAVARGPRGSTGERLYLFSGSTWFENDDGERDPAGDRYFDDAYGFDPEKNSWTKLADLPRLREARTIGTTGYEYDVKRRRWVGGRSRPVDVHALFDDTPRPAAAAVAIGDGDRVLLFSGSTGRYATLPTRDCPTFPPEVLAYDIDTDRWSVAGSLPTAVVTTAVVRWNDRFVLPSGEVRPGVRTPEVQTIQSRN